MTCSLQREDPVAAQPGGHRAGGGVGDDLPTPLPPACRGGVLGEPGCPAHPEAPLPPSSGQRQCPALLLAPCSPLPWDLGPGPALPRICKPAQGTNPLTGVRWDWVYGACSTEPASEQGRAGRDVPPPRGVRGPHRHQGQVSGWGGGTGPSELDRGWGSLPTKAHL